MENNFNPSLEKAKLKKLGYEKTFEIFIESFLGWSKWLNASLFAINSAGLIAASQLTSNGQASPLSAPIFAVGIGFTLSSAVVLQEYYSRALPVVKRLRDYWTLVCLGKERNLKFERRMKAKLVCREKLGALAPILGWSSGIAFMIGLVSLVWWKII